MESNSIVNFLNFPSEILIKIIKLAENDKNLLLSYKRFYEIISYLYDRSLTLCVDYRYFINPEFNFDSFINDSSSINFNYSIAKENSSFSNFEEKFEYILQEYGHKIKKLRLWSKIENFASKYLKLVPNLEELEIWFPISFENHKIEKLSIPLKTLKINCYLNFRELEIFTFDELQINLQNFSYNFFEFVENYKNLKCLAIYDVNFDLNEKLGFLKLEYFEATVGFHQMINFGIFLRNQTELKSLTLSSISSEIFEIICNNLEKLEKLSFSFIKNSSEEVLKEITKLKYLESLEILSTLNEKQFEILKWINLANLKILTLLVDCEISPVDIEILAFNFNNLKSLKFAQFKIINFETLAAFFENFNKLEILDLNFTCKIDLSQNDDEIFFQKSHKNENLKSLTFDLRRFEVKKFISKFILDFPNLEIINLEIFSFGNYEIIQENFEMIVKEFPKLKKIENLIITEEILENFLKYGRNLEEFKANLNIFENPNEILKNFSISFQENSLEKFRKTNEISMEFSFFNYSHWQSFKTSIDSQRKIESLKIHSTNDQNQTEKLIMKNIEKLGKSIKNLTMQGFFSMLQLEMIVKKLPNCEKITFDFVFIEKGSYKVINLRNTKIKSICLNLNVHSQSFCFSLEEYSQFFRNLKFSKNSLTYFKIFATKIDSQYHRRFLLPWVKNVFNDQENLIKISEHLNAQNNDFTFEISLE
ncbi:hypothetical protein PVAND_017269 [Polypedilum vanderplanki]|uniref:F-box domain-containing protein n=1 Tax=Polypedilum vanderplanki TaxID=319348 RepID=A0A9J6BIY4_POLVA|nr:hypothetical protein PVAND_017269 [Polypedilum vanderplanki]